MTPGSYRSDPAEHQHGGRTRSVHVIAGLDVSYGGPSYSVPRLCEALSAAGAEVALLSVAATDCGRFDTYDSGYRDRRFTQDYARLPILRALRSSSGLTRALRQTANEVDVVHNHGLWLMPNIQAGWASGGAGKPCIVSPRGMLSPVALRFSRSKKRVFWWLLQRSVIRCAACIHVTSTQEFEEIRTLGLRNPVIVIPNGIDLPQLSPDKPVPPKLQRFVLSLGRIHPKKGLDRLLHAWARIEPHYPGWHLRIAGPSESGHADELRALAKSLRLARISIEGPIIDDAKWQAYRSADLFVLPSLNENFGLTVAEALASGIPAISTQGAPWSGLEQEGCGWWVEHGVEPLVAALESAMSMTPQALVRMGASGRAWMAREFSWDRAARDLLAVYYWLAHGAEPPPTIRFD